MPFWYKKALNLTEKEVRYAIKCTTSNREAAEFLRINPDTWRKYASMYKDPETGKTLYDLHKAPPGPKSKGRFSVENGKKALMRALSGDEQSNRKISNLKNKLFFHGIFPEQCMRCGYHEQRIGDLKIPLKLGRKDGNIFNNSEQNLEILCFNCYFLYYGSDYSENMRRKIKDKNPDQ